MLYHFEFRGETCWEAFGSGEGSGPDPIAGALVDLTSVSGGTLPVGEYRYIAATGDSPRYESVWLCADGRTLAMDDLEVPERLQRRSGLASLPGG